MSGRAAMTMRERALRSLGVLVFVTLAGPVVGAVLFPTPLSGPYIWWTLLSTGEGALADKLAVLGYVVLGSYALGIVPAASAGVAMALATWRRGRFGYLLAALSGVFGAAVVWLVYALQANTADVQSNSVAMLALFVPISVATALVCRWLLGVVRILPRREATP